MSDAVAKPRWYHVTPDRFLIGLLAAVLLLLAADRFELLGLTRGSGWNVLLAGAVVCLGMFGCLIWFVAALLLKKRFQFGLKSLLVLTVVVAIPCSWFAVKIRQAKRQDAAVKAIQELRGQVATVMNVPFQRQKQLPEDVASTFAAWCRNLAGTDFLSHVVVVVLQGTQVTDAALVHLKELTKLEHLQLDDTQVTDVGLVHLKELTDLVNLWLDRTQVTDAGLVHLKELPNLWFLGLSSTEVTDAGVVHLKELKNLKSLYLRHTQVTDAGLVHLKELTDLGWLELDDTQVTDDGVEKLQKALPNCTIER